MLIGMTSDTSLDADLASTVTCTLSQMTLHVEFAQSLVDAGACIWLVPTMYCPDRVRAFSAACIIAKLHQDRAVIDQIHETGCMEDVDKVARTIYPGASQEFSEQFPVRCDFEVWKTLISEDMPVAVRLCGAIELCGWGWRASRGP